MTPSHKPNTDDNQDAAYWLAFCEGNKDSIAYFYKKYYNLLYNYGLKLVDDPLLVQDFIQDIFYKLYKSRQPDKIDNLKVYPLAEL